MANDKIYSVDDILDEYSVEKNKPVKNPASLNSDRSRRNNSLADVLTDEYSLERILIESGFSGIPDKDDDIIDISLIQIQDEPNHPETPVIISDIVDYFETDKHNEEQQFANIKENIARAEKASEDPGILDFTDDGESISQKAEKILENVRKMHEAEKISNSERNYSEQKTDNKNSSFSVSEDFPAESGPKKRTNTIKDIFGSVKRTENRSESEDDEAELRKFSLSLNKPSFSKKFEEEQEAEKAALDAAYGKHENIISEKTSSDNSDTISDDISDDAAWLNESPLSLKSIKKNDSRSLKAPETDNIKSVASEKPAEPENVKPAASVKPAETAKTPLTEAEEDEARLRKFSLPLNKPSFSKLFGGNNSEKDKDEPVKHESEKVKPVASEKPAEPENVKPAASEKASLTEEEEDEARLRKFSLPLNKPSFSKLFSGNDSEKDKDEPVKHESEKVKPAASEKPAEPENVKPAASEKAPLTEEEEDEARLRKFSLPLNKPSFSKLFGGNDSKKDKDEPVKHESEKVKPAASEKQTETEIIKPAASEKPAVPEIIKPAASEKPAVPEKIKPAASEKPAVPEIIKPAASEKPAVPEKIKPAASEKPAVPEKIKPAASEKPAVPEKIKPAASEKPAVPEKIKPAASEKPAESEKAPLTEEEEDEARLKKFSLPLNKPSFSKLFGGNDSEKKKDDPVKHEPEDVKTSASVKTAESEKTPLTEEEEDEARLKKFSLPLNKPSFSKLFGGNDSEKKKDDPVKHEPEDVKTSASVKTAESEKTPLTEEEEDEARLKKFSLPLNKPSFSKLLSVNKDENGPDKSSDKNKTEPVTEDRNFRKNKKSVFEERNDSTEDDIISAVKQKAEEISNKNKTADPDQVKIKAREKRPEKGASKPEFEKETILTDEAPSVRFKSYRSATRIQDTPNKIVKNPEDNIRYVKRDRDSGNYYPDEMRPQRKRRAETAPETKADIAPLSDLNDEENVSASHSHSVLSGLRDVISSISDTLVPPKSRSLSSGKPLIEIKSTPETGFFSIDVDINGNAPDAEQKSFIKNIDTNFSHSAEKHIDDYNSPEDASLIIDDLYDLKKNLSIKFLIELIAFIVSLYLTGSAINNIHLPLSVDPVKFPQFFGIAMFITAVAVIVTSFSVITSGFKNIIKKKPDCDSLAAVSMTFSALAAALSVLSPSLVSNKQIFIFTPVAIAAFMVNTLGKQLIVNRAVKNFKILASSQDKHALFYIDDESKAQQLTKGTVNDYPVLAVSRKTDFSADFLKYTYSSDISDKLCRKAIPFALIVSAVMTLLAVIIYSKTTKTFSLGYISSVYSLFLSAFAGFGIPLVVNIPLANAAESAKESQALILGYQSIDDFYDVNSVTVDASQLFPEHSIKLSAIKMFSDTKIDDAIIAAASIVHSSGSIFNGMFSKIIDNNTSLLEKVENYSYEESMGICGWIKNKRVLFGTRQLMVNHNIEGMPPKSKEKDIVGRGNTAIYLSVSGNLAAMFILKMKADPDAAECLDKLVSNGISVIVKSIDPVITVTRIAKLFDIPEDMIRIVPEQYHKYCDKLMSPVKKSSSSVICSGSLSSLTNALSETKSIHSRAITGLVLQSTAAIIALLLSAVFMFLGILGQINPLTLVTYHTVWLLITTLIMKIKPR